MQIRPATDEDAAVIAALWTEAYSGRGPEGRQTPNTEADYFDAARSGRIFVAEQDGSTVGVVVFRPASGPGRAVALQGEAELARLAVTAAAQRRGIGRALAELCADLARQEGVGAVALWSRTHQAEGQRLYESLGYRRAPERDSTDADGARLVFLLDLTSDPMPPGP